MTAMIVAHSECGEPVEVAGGQVFDAGGGQHLCRDYLAWHLPPDRRDPADLDVPAGWRPAPRWAEQAKAA